MMSILICNQSTTLAMFDLQKCHFLCLLFNMFEKGKLHSVVMTRFATKSEAIQNQISNISFIFFLLAFINETKQYHAKKYTVV